MNATLPPGSAAPTEALDADVCVVGGGIAGLCAALAAARSGARTILIQDRAVLGGNASSEIRMWICGAHGKDVKEAGILEELQLANYHRNPGLNYSLWDSVLYQAAREQSGLTTILSCAVCQVEMANATTIAAVRAWHLTRQCWIEVRARVFLDCSGDSVLSLSGAPARWGREARSETGEPAAQAVADRKTMGNSLLIQLRAIDPAQHRPFIAPAWARVLPEGHPRLRECKPTGHNFWWIEIGGEQDTMADADRIRDELYAIAFGVWAFIKNHPDGRGHGWELEWLGSLPGKRENIRYEGDHVLTQMDVESCGHFPDVIAYGGWTMDDHPPAAFDHPGPPTHHYPAPSPFGIPYRSLYSRTVSNLLFAGRNISCTHLAMSATRVMGTCALVGQAAGTAAAMAVAVGSDPRGIGRDHLVELRNRLMDDDSWLPGVLRPIAPLARLATVTTSAGDDPAPLFTGIDRRLLGQANAIEIAPGGWIEFRWPQQVAPGRLRLIGDSDLHRDKRQPCSWPRDGHDEAMPARLPRNLRVVVERDGAWVEVARITDNPRRLLKIPVVGNTTAVRLIVEAAWGGGPARLQACEPGLPDLLAPPVATPWPSQPVTRTSGA
ncbi:hypothetical protein LBMAG53_07450 [Planctomycetota bacterium]|nr:hypothetical protein LBMAG53_07450 [Planctomycetota bacterium]